MIKSMFQSALVVGLMMGTAGAKDRCGFDLEKESYDGNALIQARCLAPAFIEPANAPPSSVGPAKRRAAAGAPRNSLGEPLESLVDRPVAFSVAKFKAFLDKEGLGDLGEKLQSPLSTTEKGNPARYFVIHDTSANFVTKPFPADTATSMTKLGETWTDGVTWRAHAWVNRLGKIRVTYDFGRRPTRSSTRFEVQNNVLWGLFLHTEVTQPRKALATSPDDDQFVPVPAFKSPQYRAVAILYALASLRAGKWMIPAYHIAIDAHIKGGHDDPQYFSLEDLSDALKQVIKEIDNG